MIYGYLGPMPLPLKIGILFLLLAGIALCVELIKSACDDFIGKLIFTLFAVGLAIFAIYIFIFA